MPKLLATLLTAAALAGSASAGAPTAMAHEFPCQQWDVSHALVYQSNGWSVRLDFDQHGYSTFTGRALEYDNLNNFVGTGIVDGNTHGAGIHFTITWPNGSVGVYDGTLHRPFSGPSGDGDGTTYDQAHPWSRATWNIYGDARCFW